MGILKINSSSENNNNVTAQDNNMTVSEIDLEIEEIDNQINEINRNINLLKAEKIKNLLLMVLVKNIMKLIVRLKLKIKNPI